MPAPTPVGTGAAVSSTTAAVTVPYPAAYTAIADDIAAIVLECDSTSTTVTPPTGYAVVNFQAVGSGTTTKLTVLWKRLTASEAAPSLPAPTPTNHAHARMRVLRGCFPTGNPWDVNTVNQELVADTTVSVPSVTTTVADTLVWTLFSTGQDTASTAGATGWTNLNLSGLTEQMDNWTASGTGGGFAMAEGVKAAAGSVGATTATLSLTANFKALMTIAWRPALAGPTLWRPNRLGHPNLRR